VSAGSRARDQLMLRRTGDTLTGVFTQTVFLNERPLPVPLGSVYFTRLEG